MSILSSYITLQYLMIIFTEHRCNAILNLAPKRQFTKAKDALNLGILCAIEGPTAEPFKARSRLDCAHLCTPAANRNESNCVGFNYVPVTRTCTIFRYMPNFQIALGCSFYGPDVCYTATFDHNTKVASEDCSFPFTLNGQLYYQCTPVGQLVPSGLYSDTLCDVLGCVMSGMSGIAICYSSDLRPTNITTSISIPSLSGTIPVVSVNNWIMIQQKLLTDTTVLFDREMVDYQFGFGSLTGNYWMGLDNIHLLTYPGNYMLRVEVESKVDGWFSQEYSYFYVSSGENILVYELWLGYSSGDAGDSLQYPLPNPWTLNPPFTLYHGFMPFSTKNAWSGPAAVWPLGCTQYKGGWWYNCCVWALLNTDVSSQFVWNTLNNPTLRASRMMIKAV